MKPRYPLVAAALAVTATLTSCADPNLSASAEHLRHEIQAKPGVTHVTLDYVKPVVLDSGKVNLKVTMDKGATGEDVVTVGTAAYHGLLRDHQHEEADVYLKDGHNRIHLRTFEPKATTADVTAEWQVAIDAARAGRVRADINTQEVSHGNHVENNVAVRLPPGTTAHDVLPALTALERRYGNDPNRSWGVIAGTGAGMRRSPGFPSTSTRRYWRALTHMARPLTHTAVTGVDLYEHAGKSPASPIDVVTLTVTSRGSRIDPDHGASHRLLRRVATRQLASLGQSTEGFRYVTVVDGKTVVDLDSDVCLPRSDSRGKLDWQLSRDYHRLHPCDS